MLVVAFSRSGRAHYLSTVTDYKPVNKGYNEYMPRRHTPAKHTPYRPPENEKLKKRYPSKQVAENAAEIQMLQIPGLQLRVYQAPDGGWYLTRG